MRGSKKRPSGLWVLALLAWTAASAYAQVELRLGDAEVSDGQEVTVPIEVAGAQAGEVFSYFFRIAYDPALLRAAGVDNEGTLSAGMTLSANRRTPGLIVVAAGGVAALDGTGTLLNLRFEALKAGRSDLTWTEAVLNEGAPEATARNGSVEVLPLDPDAPGPAGNVAVSLPAVSGLVGEEFEVPLRIEGGDALQVLSYFFHLSYDPFVLQPLGVEAEGTLSAGMLLSANSPESGRFVVAATGATPLGGDGLLLRLRLRYLGRGTSPLALETFAFNEGDPVALKSDGEATAALGSPQGVRVSLPQAVGEAGGSGLIDIDVGQLGGQGVFSYLVRFGLDPQLARVTGFETEGTLSAGMALDLNDDGSGVVLLAASGGEALSGAGTLVRLRVEYLAGGETQLRWGDILFNEGDVPANPLDGVLQVAGDPAGPGSVLQSGSNSGFVPRVNRPQRDAFAGETVSLEIDVEGAVEARATLVRVRYDASLLEFTGFAPGDLVPGLVSSPAEPVAGDNGFSTVEVGGSQLAGTPGSGAGRLGGLAFRALAEMPPEGSFVSVLELQLNASASDRDVLSFAAGDFGLRVLPGVVVGDFDGSGGVDLQDIFLFADQFGTDESSPDWDPAYDVVVNGAVDFDDFFAVSEDFGAGF